ncbi:MAG: IS1595 family transposase [Porphyromonadaceae bacterium]|nr:IS1595 family transposase [Porphyromonadaceae bacterium]
MRNKYIKVTHISERKTREIIRLFSLDIEAESPFTNGEVELDESYFGERGKTPVFGMLKRGDKVYTQIVKNCYISELLTIIKGRTDTEAIIYSDEFKSYDGLVNYGYKKHYRVKHGENEFALGHNHINGIENFWGLCKVRLTKFRGVHRHTFYLHIKECEMRSIHEYN